MPAAKETVGVFLGTADDFYRLIEQEEEAERLERENRENPAIATTAVVDPGPRTPS